MQPTLNQLEKIAPYITQNLSWKDRINQTKTYIKTTKKRIAELHIILDQTDEEYLLTEIAELRNRIN
jgi:hypothetical protein